MKKKSKGKTVGEVKKRPAAGQPNDLAATPTPTTTGATSTTPPPPTMPTSPPPPTPSTKGDEKYRKMTYLSRGVVAIRQMFGEKKQIGSAMRPAFAFLSVEWEPSLFRYKNLSHVWHVFGAMLLFASSAFQ